MVLATRNSGKIRELRALLAAQISDHTIDWEALIIDAASAGCGEVDETGVTFEHNALLKAHSVSAQTGLPAVADDSGLSVSVLGGAPGVFSARWAGAAATDESNRTLLLEQLVDISQEHRAASLVCVVALVLPTGEQWVTRGELRGTLLTEPTGDGGFGYDPILQPDGDTRSLGEYSLAQKNSISHRAQAFTGMTPQVHRVLGLSESHSQRPAAQPPTTPSPTS